MKDKLAGRPLPVIFFTVFIDLLGFGILIPVIPQLLANPNSTFFLLPKGMTVQQGYILLGFLTGIFPLMQFVATPILGQLSDKFGRKKILAISLLGTCASYVLFAIGILTKNIPLLFVSRAFDGITGGNIAVAQAAIADITAPENRAKNFGLIGAAFGLGFIVGPYLGGKLSDPSVVSWFNAATPFWFAAILSGLNVISVLFFFPETLKTLQQHVQINFAKSIKNIIAAFSEKRLQSIFITAFLFQGGFAFFIGFFNVFLIRRFHFTQGNIGDFFAYIGLWVAFTQAVLTRRIGSIHSEANILKVTLFTTGITVFLLFLPSVWWQLLLVVPLFAMSNGLSQANLVGLVSRSAGPEIQGEILGINASVQALAMTIPPMLSGFIASSVTPEAPIFVGGVVVLSAAVFFSLFYKVAEKPVHIQESI